MFGAVASAQISGQRKSVDSAQVVHALVPGGKIPKKVAAGEHLNRLRIGSVAAYQTRDRKQSGVRRGDEDRLANRHHGGRREPSLRQHARQIRANDQPTHAVSYYIHLRCSQSVQEIAKGLRQLLDVGPGAAGCSWLDRTIVEVSDLPSIRG